MRLYYWIDHTGRSDSNNGVQRVARNLARALFEAGHELVPVRWCPERETIVRAEQTLVKGLARFDGPALSTQLEEGVPLHLSSPDMGRLDGGWLLIGEVPHVGGEDAPRLPIVLDYSRFHGLRSAVTLYDLTSLPQPSAERTRSTHEVYARSLVAADVVTAISEHSADDLREWWASHGYKWAPLPHVVATPLAAEVVGVPRVVETGEPAAPTLRTWRLYADDLVTALEQAPVLRQLVVVEGSRGSTGDAGAVSGSRVVRRLHWRTASSALLPGTRSTPEPVRPGDGQLHDVWAVVPAVSAADEDELAAILDAARGLGLRIALEAEQNTSPEIAAAADVSFFRTVGERDDALVIARRTLERTVGVSARFEVGSGAAVAEAIRRRDGRLTAAGARRTPSRVYYWVGLTVEQPFNTGVQRVTRRLATALQGRGVEVIPVKWDGLDALAPISDEEAQHLARWGGPVTRPRALPDELAGEWLLVPEITVPIVPPGSNVARLGRSLGMRVAAVFYDLIPAKMPENYPGAALEARFEYWRSFAEVDVALPISWSVAPDLQRWLRGDGSRLPRIVPCVLAGEGGAVPRVRVAPAKESSDQPLRLLAVGTWEPRKNYPRLLRALAAAQAGARRPIRLTIVGRRAGFDEFDTEIERLSAESGVVLHDHVEDDELRRLHEAASATVFASLEEGFGLPVLESLWQARPCLCHAGSAMAELLPGGGVIAVDMLDEAAVASALVRLADDFDLLERLGQESVERPIRTWDEYAEDVVTALAQVGSPPGWPLPAVARRGPLLTCAITTCNRAEWLRHSLPRLLEATRPWRDVVEVLVCDDASTDDTPEVVARFQDEVRFSSYRNAESTGMPGNLGATAGASRGAFVWLLGDGDLVVDGALEDVLEGLARHPDVEMAYLNYACTQLDDPSQEEDVARLVASAKPITERAPNRYVAELREVAGLSEDLFTAIQACVFRRDHAVRAYQLDAHGTPLTSLAGGVPPATYALEALLGRPAWCVGNPAVVVNTDATLRCREPLWQLERVPDLLDEAERHGVDPDRLDAIRLRHLVDSEQWVRTVYLEGDDAIRESFSLPLFLERSKHLPEFRERHLPGVRRAYEAAWSAGRVPLDAVPPDELFHRYGL